MKVAHNVAETLKLLVRSGGEVSVSDVGRHLGLNRSTASRLLAALKETGLLDRAPDGSKYTAGPLALHVGACAQNRYDRIGWVAREMIQVVEATGHTTCLGVLNDLDVLIVKTQKHHNPSHLAMDVGSLLPAHASALGKILLAEKSDEELRTLLPDELPKLANATVTSKEGLLAEIAATRRQGISVSKDEIATGITAYAVAIRTDGESSVAVGVAFLSAGQEDEDGVVTALRNFKTRVERALSV